MKHYKSRTILHILWFMLGACAGLFIAVSLSLFPPGDEINQTLSALLLIFSTIGMVASALSVGYMVGRESILRRQTSQWYKLETGLRGNDAKKEV